MMKLQMRLIKLFLKITMPIATNHDTKQSLMKSLIHIVFIPSVSHSCNRNIFMQILFKSQLTILEYMYFFILINCKSGSNLKLIGPLSRYFIILVHRIFFCKFLLFRYKVIFNLLICHWCNRFSFEIKCRIILKTKSIVILKFAYLRIIVIFLLFIRKAYMFIKCLSNGIE